MQVAGRWCPIKSTEDVSPAIDSQILVLESVSVEGEFAHVFA